MGERERHHELTESCLNNLGSVAVDVFTPPICIRAVAFRAAALPRRASGTKGGVVDRFGELFDIARGDKCRQAPAHAGGVGVVIGDHLATGGNGLENRYAEPFVVGRKYKDVGPSKYLLLRILGRVCYEIDR